MQSSVRVRIGEYANAALAIFYFRVNPVLEKPKKEQNQRKHTHTHTCENEISHRKYKTPPRTLALADRTRSAKSVRAT